MKKSVSQIPKNAQMFKAKFESLQRFISTPINPLGEITVEELKKLEDYTRREIDINSIVELRQIEKNRVENLMNAASDGITLFKKMYRLGNIVKEPSGHYAALISKNRKRLEKIQQRITTLETNRREYEKSPKDFLKILRKNNRQTLAKLSDEELVQMLTRDFKKLNELVETENAIINELNFLIVAEDFTVVSFGDENTLVFLKAKRNEDDQSMPTTDEKINEILGQNQPQMSSQFESEYDDDYED